MADKIPQLNLGVEIEEASKMFDLKIDNPVDLKNVGLATDILNILAIKFRDDTLNENFNKEFADIHLDIFDSIQNPNTGYLLELVVYTDEFGFITLPQGRIINPIGIGVEPLDSMATYINTNMMLPGSTPAKNLKNNSSFLWITKDNGKLSAKSIDTVFHKRFMDLSITEAKKRKMMGAWIKLNDDTNLKELQIAQFWSETEKQRKASLPSDEAKAKVEKLTKEMQELQEKTNELYKQFQKTQEKMVEAQKLANTLAAIGTVASILKTGIEANQTMSKSDKQIKNGDDSHLLSYEEITTTVNKRVTDLGVQNTTLTTDTQFNIDKMGAIHIILSNEYKIDVQPPQKLENNPLLKLP
jgi:hypothetical protein